MNCSEFKKYWIEGNINDLDSDLQKKTLDHFHSCKACRDATLAATLEARGVDVASYPCVHMAQYAEFHCDQHPDPKDCHDATIKYDEIFDEYSIPHGDGVSQLTIIIAHGAELNFLKARGICGLIRSNQLVMTTPGIRKYPKNINQNHGEYTANKQLKPTSTALLVLCFSATLAQNNQLRSGGLAGRYTY